MVECRRIKLFIVKFSVASQNSRYNAAEKNLLWTLSGTHACSANNDSLSPRNSPVWHSLCLSNMLAIVHTVA